MKKQSYATSSSPKRRSSLGQLLVDVTKFTEGRDGKGYITISHKLANNYPSLTVPTTSLLVIKAQLLNKEGEK